MASAEAALGMIKALSSVSRELRKPFRRLETAMQSLLDMIETTGGWRRKASSLLSTTPASP